MKYCIFPIILLSVLLTGCENETGESAPSNTKLSVTVYNAAEWSVTNINPLCVDATVMLTTNSDTFSGTTDVNGKVIFNDIAAGTYDFVASKGDLSNLIEKDAGTGRGFIAIGIFQNKAEISDYTNDSGELLQPDAEPGDLKITDVNADGIITADDKVLSESYYFMPYDDLNADGIINEDDKIDGSYQYLENVEKEVYIGQ